MKTTILTTIAPLFGAFLVWALVLEENPNRTNVISTENTPMVSSVLPADQAITLTQVRDKNEAVRTLLVTDTSDAVATTVDLVGYGATLNASPFRVITELGREKLTGLFAQAQSGENGVATKTYPFSALEPAAGTAIRHIGSGTNFPEHAEETASELVFNFPKFGAPTPPVTTIAYDSEVLLDYEVEICVRFDRDIATIEDFDVAQKGFFLCGDFTDRSKLMRLIDPDNFDSGSGFSDSKSGPDFFPSGPFLVIPTDWKEFVAEERIQTYRGGELRQDSRGGEMIVNFRELVGNVLGDTTSTRFVFKGQNTLLVEDATISEGQALMSGTPEGVIFMPPTARQIARGIIGYVTSGTFLSSVSGYQRVIESFIDEERDSKRFLQIGETIDYVSSSMGSIHVSVVD